MVSSQFYIYTTSKRFDKLLRQEKPTDALKHSKISNTFPTYLFVGLISFPF